MADEKPKSGRAVAVEVLNRCDPEKNYAGPILDRLLGKTDQRQRATDLVFGTMRNRGAIDTVIAAFSGRAVERIQDKIRNVIRIGVYELIYAPASEAYAVVNEAVENAKTATGDKQAGFVNAVLRQVVRHISDRQVPLLQADTRRTLPQTPSTGCQFDTDFLPDGKTSPVEYLSRVSSLPEWLVGDWVAEFGEESTRRICFASNRRPSIYVRPNKLRTTAVVLAGKLRQAGIEPEIVPVVTPAKAGTQECDDMKRTEPVDFCSPIGVEDKLHRNDKRDESMIRIRSPRAIPQLPAFAEGEFTVQDVTASRAVRLLNPQSGWRILDLCAAPGVKTTQLAEATCDSATILATDIDRRRLEMLRGNIARLGVKSINVVAFENWQGLADEMGLFDAVLLDVPCSNTGVLARRIEARYRVSPQAVQALTKIQTDLLSTAAARVKPQGKICYSTCSIQKCENGERVRDFLRRNPSFALESEELIMPSAEDFDHDGGYTAIVVKK